MSTRPSSTADWATNANYAAGPAIGTPTKVAPSVGDVQEGYEPAQEPGAQKFNYQLNLLGQWTDWLNAGLLPTGRQLLTGSGTYTPTTGTRAVRVRMVGGGGGGGSAATTGTNGGAAAGGGASGVYWEKWISPGALVTGGAFACGVAGVAGDGGLSPPFDAGGTGGDTTIVVQTTTYTAKGGFGGAADTSINTDFPRFSAGGGGVQTGSSSGDIVAGDNGGDGLALANLASPHFYCPSGKGGSGSWGVGGANNNGGAGSAGTGSGAGGGGGSIHTNSGSAYSNGAAGTAGQIIVEEFA